MPLDNSSTGLEDIRIPTDFNKIKVGIKTLEDATINVGSYKKVNPKVGNKEWVLKAISRGDLSSMR